MPKTTLVSKVSVILFSIFILASCANTTLLAVNTGNVAVIMDIPENKINKPLILGRTPLMQAIISSQKESVIALLKKKANPNISTPDGNSPLIEASAKGLDEIVKLLLENGAHVFATNDLGNTALHYAADKGFPTIVKLLIDAGSDINALNNQNLTPTSIATVLGFDEIVEQLINTGADLNIGNPPLVQSAFKGHLELTKLLIASGADVDATNKFGVTALMFSAQNGFKQLTELFLKHGADINKSNNEGATPLILASIKKQHDIIKVLIKEGANIDSANNDGITSLIQAAIVNDYITSQILLDAGANPSFKSNAGTTALIEATIKNNYQIVKQLIQAGAELDTQSNHGDTAIIWAVSNNWFNIVGLLIDAGANPYINSNKGQNAFDFVKGRQNYANLLNRYNSETAKNIKSKKKQKPRNDTPNHINYLPQKTGTGTGFYINSEGYIVTNYHVVKSCKKLEAISDNEKYELESIHVDKWNDLALLRNTTKTSKDYVNISNTNTTSIGEELVTLGYPLSSMMGNSIKLTTGILSGESGLGGDTSKYQISAPIQPGNSGGPVFDSNSDVAGVVVSRLSDSYMLEHQGQIGQNVNFAIKSSVLKNFLEVNNISYLSNNSLQKVAAKEIYNQNKESVLMIICYE